jgi:ketopantoate reductase
MKYGVIGTGAIGGYYGAKLAHAGQECLKSVNNDKLQTLLPPLLHDHTLVVLIQNGIGVLRMSLSGMMEMKKNNYYCIQTDKQIHFFYGRQYQIRRFS